MLRSQEKPRGGQNLSNPEGIFLLRLFAGRAMRMELFISFYRFGYLVGHEKGE